MPYTLSSDAGYNCSGESYIDLTLWEKALYFRISSACIELGHSAYAEMTTSTSCSFVLRRSARLRSLTTGFTLDRRSP